VTKLLQNTPLQIASGLLLLDNRIYIPSAGSLHTHILQYNHDHILTGHFCQNKILELVYHEYSWPSLCADVQQFCKSYVTCMWSKLQHHKPYRSLKQLLIPEQSWNSISMDFIEKLPLSSGFDTILVIVDCFTKQVIFISAHDTIMFTDLAHLFVLHVFSKYNIPSYVTSDRGLEFMSNFFRSLGTMSKSLMVDFVFIFSFLFLEQTWIRVYQSCCHISHKLMV